MMKPTVKLTGTDGNVFSIISKVSRAFKKAGDLVGSEKFTNDAMNAKSYDDVLMMAMDRCEVE